MTGEEFNRQFDTLVAEPLSRQGFERHRKCLSLARGTTVLALLRVRTKWDGLAQKAGYIACVRHQFLRNIESELPTGFVSDVNEYPFKLPVLKLSKGMLSRWNPARWHYVPINLSPRTRHYDTIAYGDMHDASGTLTRMTKRLGRHGRKWMDYLTPERALAEIERHAEDAYCERIWIEDYEAHLSGRS